MHGDAHLNNVLLRRDRPELAAFIDWEMCTIGDPLLDLGWMLVCWPLDTNTITRARNWPRSADWRRRPNCSTRTAAAGGRTDLAAGLVHGDGLLQARHRHRGHLVAISGRAGEPGRG